MATTFENYWVGKDWDGNKWLPPELNSEYYNIMKHTVVILEVEKPNPIDHGEPNPLGSHLSVTGRKRKHAPGAQKRQLPPKAQNVPVEKIISMRGGGVLVSPYGHILTAYHVIEDALEICVRSTKENEFVDALFVAGDHVTDLAIIRTRDNISDRDGHPTPYVKFASADTVEVGAQAVSINHALGLCHSFCLGYLAYPSKISADGRDGSTECLDKTYEWRRAADCYESEKELQTFKPSLKVLQLANTNGHHGASGCPVLNSAGLLIGLHVFMSKSYDCAIAIDSIKNFVSEVLDDELSKGRLSGCLEGPIISTLTGTRREYGGEAKNLGNTKCKSKSSGKKCLQIGPLKNALNAQGCGETCGRSIEGARAFNLRVTGSRTESVSKCLRNTMGELAMPAKTCAKRRRFQHAYLVHECTKTSASRKNEDQRKTCDRSGEEKMKRYTRAIGGCFKVKEMRDHLKTLLSDHIVPVKSNETSLEINQGVAEMILSLMVGSGTIDYSLDHQVDASHPLHQSPNQIPPHQKQD